jgi:hypothetical protein
MPKGKNATQAPAEDIEERLDAEVDALVAEAPAIIQRHRPAIYRRMEGDPGGQFAGLWIETKRNLLNVEVRVLGALTYWVDIHAALAPLIRAWNIQGPKEATVTKPAVMSEDGSTVIVPERQVTELVYEVLPPPMEAGPGVFESIDQLTKHWVWSQVQNAPYKQDPDEGKG